MSLMISVSGIRGVVGESLTPKNLTAFAMAFAALIVRQRERREGIQRVQRPKIVIGRDTRPTGKAISDLVSNTLLLCGCDVVDLGVATTPTVEIAVPGEHADGGLIITASHNPVAWNALKMLNHQGEFLNAADVDELLAIADEELFVTAHWDSIGTLSVNERYDALHSKKVLDLPALISPPSKKSSFGYLLTAWKGLAPPLSPNSAGNLASRALSK